MHGGSIGRNSYLVAKLCPALCNNMDCSPPGSSVHGILQDRIPEWIAISSATGSSRPRDQTCISCTAGGFFTSEPPGKPMGELTKYRCRKQEASEVSSMRTFFYRLWNKEQGFLRWVKVPGAYVEGRSLNEGKGSSSQHRRGGSKDRYTCRQTCRYSYSNLIA